MRASDGFAPGPWISTRPRAAHQTITTAAGVRVATAYGAGNARLIRHAPALYYDASALLAWFDALMADGSAVIRLLALGGPIAEALRLSLDTAGRPAR